MTTTVLTSVNREQMVGKLTALMEEKFEDYNPCKAEFLEAVNSLKMELGEAPVNKMLAALERRCEVDILFSGSLGYQANLDNFRNPAARTFLDMDFDDYLKVNVVAKMPQRSEAEREIDEFCRTLNEEQKEIFEAVSSYMVYLELSLTKLAHYKGFMIANEILPFTEPGYSCNCILYIFVSSLHFRCELGIDNRYYSWYHNYRTKHQPPLMKKVYHKITNFHRGVSSKKARIKNTMETTY